MARKDNSIPNVFEDLKGLDNDDSEGKNIENDNKVESKTDEAVKSDLNDLSDVSEGEGDIESINPSKTVEETSDDTQNDFSDFKKSILDKYNEKKNTLTMEQTHKRTTFLLRKDLAKRLDKLTKNKRGLKTLVLNDAVEAIVIAMEEEK